MQLCEFIASCYYWFLKLFSRIRFLFFLWWLHSLSGAESLDNENLMKFAWFISVIHFDCLRVANYCYFSKEFYTTDFIKDGWFVYLFASYGVIYCTLIDVGVVHYILFQVFHNFRKLLIDGAFDTSFKN